MKHKLDEEVEDILTHFGVKGMKWGVRRDPIDIQGGEGGGGGGEGEEEEDEELLDEAKEQLEELMKSGKDLVSKFSTKISKADKGFMKFGKGLINRIKNNPVTKAHRDFKKAVKQLERDMDASYEAFEEVPGYRPVKPKRSMTLEEANAEIRKINRAAQRYDAARQSYKKASLKDDPVIGNQNR